LGIFFAISYIPKDRRGLMPAYDYACPNCGYEIVNIRQTVEEHEKQMVCPKCGEDMETVPAAPPFKLIGKDWQSKGRT
jgi:putative FmdB family regulatory protein